MERPHQLAAAALIMAAPLSAYAQGAPHTGAFLYSFGGGLLGGLIGALLACWLCKRRGSHDDTAARK
jgi:hypothetical protein